MTRQEAHFDAMLRHLGATYYQTLKGEASLSDVARALESVEREAAQERGTPAGAEPLRRTSRTGRWRVRDVMATDSLTVDRRTSGAALAKLMSEHHTNAVPVLTGGRKVAGVVSEADLLRIQHRRGGAGRRRGRLFTHRAGASRPGGYLAEELMTAPAITIHPDAPLAGAARRMTEHNLTMLPVVGASNELLGTVSRRDLLKVFLRTDDEIADEVRQVLTDVLLLDPDAVKVTAHDGLVTLAGQVERQDLAPIAVRLAGEVDGVMAVAGNLTVAPVTAAQQDG